MRYLCSGRCFYWQRSASRAFAFAAIRIYDGNSEG